MMFIVINLLDAIAIIIHYILTIYMWLIIVRALISWVNPDPYNPIVNFLYQVTEPVLYQIRRYLPLRGLAIDLSPIVAFIIIIFLDRFLVGTLQDIVLRLK
jgi:YggT family protein